MEEFRTRLGEELKNAREEHKAARLKLKHDLNRMTAQCEEQKKEMTQEIESLSKRLEYIEEVKLKIYEGLLSSSTIKLDFDSNKDEASAFIKTCISSSLPLIKELSISSPPLPIVKMWRSSCCTSPPPSSKSSPCTASKRRSWGGAWQASRQRQRGLRIELVCIPA